MKTTPTRRRRRDNSVMESWSSTGDGDAVDASLPAAPLLTAPPHQAAAMRDDATTAASSAGTTGTPTPTPVPELDRPTQLNVPALGEMQSVETILAATELLQRLDRLQAELERGTQDVHLAHDYRASCAEIITTFPWLALSKELDQRLWSSWQRELAALESCLSAAGDGVEGKARVEKQLRDALYVALSSYGSLIQKLKTSAIGATGLDPTTALLVHRLSLSHAHVLYALEIHSASQNHKNWRVPEQFYERARRWGVAQGETHYHLARIVLHDGRCADALYHLLRSRVADVAFDSPGSLADQYLHIASLRSSDSSEEASLPSETVCWLQLDRAVIAAVAPYFGQEQEFIAQRRAPRELALALCKVLDSVCVDDASRLAGEDTSAAAESLKIVRIVSLLVACACLSKDFVAPSGSVVPSENDFVAVKNPRAIELIVSFVNALLHRALGAITSPLRTTKQKEHALQLMLPPINVAFSWLIKLQWREVVAEATRTSCEQLSTMMLTGIIAGGFLAPLKEPTSLSGQEQTAATVLVEAIELCGLPCFARIDGISTLSVDPDAGLDGSDDEALLQCRIGKFLSQVEAFMTPRPAVAAVIAEVEPSAATMSAPIQVSPPVNASAIVQVTNELEQAAISANGTSAAVVPDGRGNASSARELWTPAKLTSAAASSKNNKPAKSASVPKPVALPAPLKPKTEERVVVLDAANIAMRHGLQRRFSCRGIQLCAEFFIAQGNRVVAFLPDYCLDVDSDGAFRRRATASSGGRARRREGRCTITPDDRVLVEIMVDTGVVVLTPAMDSDDLYCIHYAKRYNAFLVTNDLFRDHISDTDGPRSRQTELRNWLQARRISYTWVGDEFLPNPNSAYEKLRSGSSS